MKDLLQIRCFNGKTVVLCLWYTCMLPLLFGHYRYVIILSCNCPRRHDLVVRAVACEQMKHKDLGLILAQTKWFFLLSSGIGGRNKWIQTQLNV